MKRSFAKNKGIISAFILVVIMSVISLMAIMAYSADTDEAFVIRDRYSSIIQSRMMEIEEPLQDWILDYSVSREYTMEEISDLFNVSMDELYELKEIGNYDQVVAFLFSSSFESSFADEIGMLSSAIPDPDAPGVGIETIQQYTIAGDIHITPLSSTWGISHGHAALAIDAYTNLETYGGEDLSSVRPNDGWGNYNAYALYYVPSISVASAGIAANYGEDNLQGLEYSAFATVTASKVNCASLVWKAYENSGVITLDYLWGLPYAPKLLTDATQTDWFLKYNWAYPQ